MVWALTRVVLVALAVLAWHLDRKRVGWRDLRNALGMLALIDVARLVTTIPADHRLDVFLVALWPGVIADLAYATRSTGPSDPLRRRYIAEAFFGNAVGLALAHSHLGALYLPALAATRWAAAAVVLVAAASPQDAAVPRAARACAFVLGGGLALGTVGAWAGDPWRSWGLAQGLTLAEYVVMGAVMLAALWKTCDRGG